MSEDLMTDAELVRYARRIDALLKQVQELASEVEAAGEEGDERAAEFSSQLGDNGIPVYAWATHVVSGVLDPEKWETRHHPVRNGILFER